MPRREHNMSHQPANSLGWRKTDIEATICLLSQLDSTGARALYRPASKWNGTEKGLGTPVNHWPNACPGLCHGRGRTGVFVAVFVLRTRHSK